MLVRPTSPVEYALAFGSGEQHLLNSFIGREISLSFNGDIQCVSCNRAIQKSYNQGYCYPCFIKLAACDTCIVKPELCHFSEGTCREPEWGLSYCMQPHIVYLAFSSDVKVGITRCSQIPTRWIDQGAIQALPLYQVNSRFHSGLVECLLKEYFADKTNWREMLSSDPQGIDLLNYWQETLSQADIGGKIQSHPILRDQVTPLYNDHKIYTFNYPVSEYPLKVRSISIAKTPTFHGVLQGIKGQYLMFDIGVINIRKYTGYHCDIRPLD